MSSSTTIIMVVGAVWAAVCGVVYLHGKDELAVKQAEIEVLTEQIQAHKDVLTLVFGEEFDLERLQIDEVSVSAYSSTRRQTDDTPWETATGEHVGPAGAAVSRDLVGLMGQRVLLVDVGVVTINDVMNRRHEKSMDLWVGSEKAAFAFGRVGTTALWLED